MEPFRAQGRVVLIGSAAGRVGGGAVHILVRWLAKAEAKHGADRRQPGGG